MRAKRVSTFFQFTYVRSFSPKDPFAFSVKSFAAEHLLEFPDCKNQLDAQK